jgi:hypothetical protein
VQMSATMHACHHRPNRPTRDAAEVCPGVRLPRLRISWSQALRVVSAVCVGRCQLPECPCNSLHALGAGRHIGGEFMGRDQKGRIDRLPLSRNTWRRRT